MSENIDKILEVKSEPVNPVNKESSQKITPGAEETKYPALLVISGIYKALAKIAGIVACIAILYGLIQLPGYDSERAMGISIIISSLIFGIVGIISFLAISEIIKLFIDLEDNSRKQIDLLKNILEKNEL